LYLKLGIFAVIGFLAGCNEKVPSQESRPSLSSAEIQQQKQRNSELSANNEPQEEKIMAKRQVSKGEVPKVATWQNKEASNGEFSGATALVSGTVSVQQGCLLVATGDGRFVLPVFPLDAVRWDNTNRVLVFKNKNYRDGDPITLGGGGIQRSSVFTQDPANTIPQCGNVGLFVVSA
jgi:hypothetical protein